MDKTTSDLLKIGAEKLKETATEKFNNLKTNIDAGNYDSVKETLGTTAKKARSVASKAAAFLLEKLKEEE